MFWLVKAGTSSNQPFRPKGQIQRLQRFDQKVKFKDYKDLTKRSNSKATKIWPKGQIQRLQRFDRKFKFKDYNDLTICSKLKSCSRRSPSTLRRCVNDRLCLSVSLHIYLFSAFHHDFTLCLSRRFAAQMVTQKNQWAFFLAFPQKLGFQLAAHGSDHQNARWILPAP